MKAELRIVDRMDATLVETHNIEFDSMDITGAYTAVKKILGQWMEKEDRLIRLETHEATDGRMLTPYVIECYDGETSDIFGQLFWDNSPVIVD